MKVIDQSVELVYPTTPFAGVAELKHIEIAGRNCWQSEGKITDESYEPFVNNLLKRGHESPVEFGHVIVRIVTSRDVLAELTRHRIGVSFAVESQRYVDESATGNIEFIKPLFYKQVPDDATHPYDDPQFAATMTWLDTMENIEGAYNRMRDLGLRNEDARKVLPNSTATTIMMDANLRELLHIYKLRSAKSAYPEMRECMRLLKKEVDRVLPGFLPDEEGKQ